MNVEKEQKYHHDDVRSRDKDVRRRTNYHHGSNRFAENHRRENLRYNQSSWPQYKSSRRFHKRYDESRQYNFPQYTSRDRWYNYPQRNSNYHSFYDRRQHDARSYSENARSYFEEPYSRLYNREVRQNARYEIPLSNRYEVLGNF